MLPYMTFRTPGDSVINTGGFRRRTTLFTVWASYDTPSRQQMQVVRKIREKYSAPYLNVVSVSLDTDEKHGEKYCAATRSKVGPTAF